MYPMRKYYQPEHEQTIPLSHSAACSLTGVTPDWHIYVDETEPDGYVTQHHYNAAGALIERAIERQGDDWLTLPDVLLSPRWPDTHPLNTGGARWQGLRETERVQSLAQSLSIMQKMTLIEHLGLSITPMQLIGMIESRVLCETRLPDDSTLVCRRVRLARALPNIQHDDNGNPYDYDSVVLHLLHPYDATSDATPDLDSALSSTGGVQLMQPQDCFYYDGRLLVCDASDGTQTSRLVLYRLNIENPGATKDSSDIHF
jgi:hypothetical protein